MKNIIKSIILTTLLIVSTSCKSLNDTQDGSNYNSIAMLIDKGDGSYFPITSETWPTDKYVFSKGVCANGSEISWDKDSDSAIFNVNNGDTCTVYFEGKQFADYLISTYSKDGENGLYYHDGNGDYVNHELEAGDNSYRYAGANPNNYVCFGSYDDTCPKENLYRIIGIFNDTDNYQVKLIKASFLEGTYTWSGTTDENAPNSWRYSTFNSEILNKTYLDSFSSVWQDKISFHDWAIGGISTWWYGMGHLSNAKVAYDYELGDNKIKEGEKYCYNSKREKVDCAEDDLIYNSKVALMYLTDYYYAASPEFWSLMGNNKIPCSDSKFETERCGPEYDYRKAAGQLWLNLSSTGNKYEMLLTRAANYNHVVYATYPSDFDVTDYRGVILDYNVYRPAFYLDSQVKYVSGIGTEDNPYRIN